MNEVKYYFLFRTKVFAGSFFDMKVNVFHVKNTCQQKRMVLEQMNKLKVMQGLILCSVFGNKTKMETMKRTCQVKFKYTFVVSII